MPWFYANNPNVIGPLSDLEFSERVNRGEVHAKTWIWHHHFPQWKQWDQVLQEGTYSGHSEGSGTDDNRPKVGPILQEAWGLFCRHPWGVIGRVSLSLLVGLLVTGTSWILQLLLPVVGGLVGILVMGPLNTGTALMLLEYRRSGVLSLRTVRRAFGPRYPQLILGQVVQTALLMLASLPLLLGTVLLIAPWVILKLQLGRVPAGLGLIGLGVDMLLMLLGVVLFFYFSVAWMYAPLLILDRGMDFWPAMKRSRQVTDQHPWLFSWFLLVVSVIAPSGLLLFGVGIFATVPLAMLMVVLAYERQTQFSVPQTYPTIPTGSAAPGPANPGSNPPPEC